MSKYLVIGCGYAGSIMAERISSQLDGDVTVIDRRDHIGGNAFDFYDNNDILVHKYGPHIFHTNSTKVWDYLSKFTEWIPYEHRVRADVDGVKVPVPFNLNSLHALFSPSKAEKLESLLVKHFGRDANIPILTFRKTSVPELIELADFVYKKIFYGYTLKQWGLGPEELDPSVTARVPVRISRDDRYFQDRYQAIPKNGYTQMFRNMLNSDKIELRLKTDFQSFGSIDGFQKVIYTGPIDEFFEFKYGHLPYRSLKFRFDHHDIETFQSVAQMNFPNSEKFTRITEFKHITSQESPTTTVAVEFPEPFVQNRNEPYYPIPVSNSRLIYEKYREEALHLKNKVLFVGRLAEYRYFNMDQIVGRALSLFEKEVMG